MRFIDLNVVRGRANSLISMNRSGVIAIVDEKGREKERYHVVYGARLKVEENQPVKLGELLAEWDPYTFSILTEVGGTIQFKDLQPGITIEEQVDEVTGLSQLVRHAAARQTKSTRPQFWFAIRRAARARNT